MAERSSKVGLLRAYGVPALFLFCVPVLALWFSGHAAGRYDDRVREAALRAVATSTTGSEEAREAARQFYESVPFSEVCGSSDPDLARMAADHEDLCSDYRQFGWIRSVSLACLALGAGVFVLALLSVAASFVSQAALYASFLVASNVLKLTSLLQAVGQGFLLTMLSYWMTAVWFERYFVKLVGVVGLLALLAVARIVIGMFQRLDTTTVVRGTVLAPDAAPALHARVRTLCERLGTAPPTQIVVGIDDNFFVTENPVRVSGTLLSGRTLFVSLSLLRALERDEADAVLAHEMAHFSGSDTLYGRKMSPLLARYRTYLAALAQGGITLPIFYFMLAFWSLFQVASARISRAREHRADTLAAQSTSPGSIGRALLKIGAYASYRARVERSLFAEDAPHRELGIQSRVALGFASYATSPSVNEDLKDAPFPHPFDTHPGLRERLATVGADLPEARYAEIVAVPVADSWTAEIHGAEDLERGLWEAYEAEFASAHEEDLAFRYLPATDEERAVVEKHFPEVRVPTKTGDGVLVVDHVGFRVPGGDERIPFSDVTHTLVEERTFRGKWLVLRHRHDADKGVAEVRLDRFADQDAVLQCFGRYQIRDRVARQRQAKA